MNRYYANLGDVWKHLALSELLALEPPKHYWETHAGSASYPLTHSPDRDYGVFWFLEQAEASPELAQSRYAAELRLLAGENEAPATYPGSALLAMRILGQQSEYLLCDLDPDSTASLRAAAAELGLEKQERIRDADGMTTVLEEARRFKGDPAEVVVTIDPFEPFVVAGGASALEVAAALLEGGFKVVYWYGYDAPEQRAYPMGMLREYAREASARVWCGDLILASTLGHSEEETQALLAGAEGPGAGCGIVCANFLPFSNDRCGQLGGALARAWEGAVLPNGNPGALQFMALES